MIPSRGQCRQVRIAVNANNPMVEGFTILMIVQRLTTNKHLTFIIGFQFLEGNNGLGLYRNPPSCF